ncbi:MAG: thioredoxin family protein [Candidatus Accumulibacter sp.]|jgi:thioredoxin-related protein|nr:thioredoxin family protein [Accumulibacter sp.]
MCSSVKRFIGLALILCALAFPGSAMSALFSIEGHDLASELQTAQREGRRLVVFFELPDCPKCLKMKRQVFSSPRVEKQFGRHYRAVRIDLASTASIIDTQGKQTPVQEMAQQLHIFGAPAFAFFSDDGSLEYRHMGSLTQADDFLRLGRFVLNAAYEQQPFSDYRHTSVHH